LLALELLGMREKTASFPSAGFSLGRMETVWKKHHLIVDFYREMRKYALEHARPDVVAAIDGCLALGDAG
jgi:hypothetical protein